MELNSERILFPPLFWLLRLFLVCDEVFLREEYVGSKKRLVFQFLSRKRITRCNTSKVMPRKADTLDSAIFFLSLSILILFLSKSNFCHRRHLANFSSTGSLSELRRPPAV